MHYDTDMEVRTFPNTRRPGTGLPPKRESSRPLLPQHARHCPVLEAGSMLGFMVYAPLEPKESLFVEFDIGISEADTITPPRGTRVNYLALGGAGGTFALGRRLHLLGVIRWVHVSNGGREGRSRNPDIEAVGPQIGVLIPF